MVGEATELLGGLDGLVLNVGIGAGRWLKGTSACLLYTSDAADERSSVDLGGRRIIKKKKEQTRLRGEGSK